MVCIEWLRDVRVGPVGVERFWFTRAGCDGVRRPSKDGFTFRRIKLSGCAYRGLRSDDLLSDCPLLTFFTFMNAFEPFRQEGDEFFFQ